MSPSLLCRRNEGNKGDNLSKACNKEKNKNNTTLLFNQYRTSTGQNIGIYHFFYSMLSLDRKKCSGLLQVSLRCSIVR